MPFAQITDKKTFTDAKKLEYIKLPPGRSIVRILDKHAYAYETHYVNRMTIACIGEECPICANNRKIISENPETFRDVKGYTPRVTRYYVNALDKTPGRICPKCGNTSKLDNESACSGCGTLILDVEKKPLNRVVVLAKGKTLFEQLNAIEESILDDNGSSKSLSEYDIVLSVTGTGRTTNITPIPNDRGEKNEVVVVPDSDKFDLDKVVIKLESDEINSFLRGVSLKDIYTARKLDRSSDAEQKTEEASEKLVADADKILKEMFGN